ncbi:hypothetical protein D3C87_1363550 [compost metagenome]
MGRDDCLGGKCLEPGQDSALHAWWQMQLWLLERHHETAALLNSFLCEMEEKKEALQ